MTNAYLLAHLPFRFGSSSQFLCHTFCLFSSSFLGSELHGALIAARECVELGHFNMAAVQQRTVLLGPARRYWCQMSVQTREKVERCVCVCVMGGLKI